MENYDTEGSSTKSTSGDAASDVLLVEKAPKKNRPGADLSAEIAMAVEKEKGERVRVRRVYGDNYRCNWLSLDTRGGNRGAMFALDTYRVRASKFLRARKVDDRLVIEDLTAQARNN